MFADNLKRIRKQKKISQESLAASINKTQQTISWYESGKVYPSIKVIEKLSNTLGVSVLQLLDEDTHH